MRESTYGKLISPAIKLHRQWFKEMTDLLGIYCKYREPLANKTFDKRGDLVSGYKKPITVGVIFEEHPTQQSLKKMGWVAELQEGSSIIHVPYDLPGIQVGALFDIPSGIDNAKARTFRVISLQNIMVYPASITCEVALEYENVDEQHLITDVEKEEMPLLIDREEDD